MTVRGTAAVGEWVFQYEGVRVGHKPEPCPWPYMVTRLGGKPLMIVQVHRRTLSHRPSGDWLELRWDPATGERSHVWHAVSGSRDLTRQAEAFALLARRKRGRPKGRESIEDPDDVAGAYTKLMHASGGQPPSQERTAGSLGLGLRALQKYRRRHGIPWPPI